MIPFSDPTISAWQSAVAAAEARARSGTSRRGAAANGGQHDTSLTLATARAAAASGAAASDFAYQPTAQGAIGETAERCAKAYLALALAEASGNAERIAAARLAVPQFGDCDPRWADAIKEFLIHYPLTKHGNVPYMRWKDLTDFVLDADADLPDDAVIAIVGDWGTGGARAQALMEAIASHQPDILIHLGDIYYSGDAAETQLFVSNIKKAFPRMPRVFSLCGNHDMYSGGAAYYAMINQLGQPASFFCLRNRNWQLLAADTGYNDFDPFTVASGRTWIQDGTDLDEGASADRYSELVWHCDKIANADGRKTILCTHHPLFSLSAPIAEQHAVNDRMRAQLATHLDDITLWFWGHEHNLALYEPFAGLARGRCMGAGSVPVEASEPIYAASTAFPAGTALPSLVGGGAGPRLRIDATSGLWDLGYSVVTLAGAAGHTAYFSFNETDGPVAIYREDL